MLTEDLDFMDQGCFTLLPSPEGKQGGTELPHNIIEGRETFERWKGQKGQTLLEGSRSPKGEKRQSQTEGE